MKTKIFILSVVLLFGCVSLVQATVIDGAAVYIFDDVDGTTIPDDSAYSNLGTLQNGATTSTDTPFAYPGNLSLSLDGTDDYMSIARQAPGALREFPNTGDGDLTFEAHIKPSDQAEGWLFRLSHSTASHYYAARLRKIGGELKIESFATGTGASGTATSSALTADEWVHVAITMDRGTGIQIYIDGIADGLAAWTGPGNTGDLQANYNHLGAEWGSTGGNYFKGLMDEVRFTAGLLDSTTIAYDAANSLVGSQDQNRIFNAPKISSIVCDGNLADWDEFSEQSLPFIWWKGDPNESTTTASFAWSDANDMLYIAVETDVNSIQVGGHLAIGITLDPNSSPTATSSPGATQLMFDVAGGNSVDIGNEIQYYTDTYGFGWAGGGIEGVQAGQSTVVVDGNSIVTYEIAIPLWEDWVLMSNGDTISPQELSAGTKVYLYAIMETALESDEGTNMTYFGDPNFWSGNWDEAAEIVLNPTLDDFDGVPIPGDAVYIFDGTIGAIVPDDSVSTNLGTLENGATTSTDTPFAYPGNLSLSLDGTDDYMSIARQAPGALREFPNTGDGDLTFEAHIKPSDQAEGWLFRLSHSTASHYYAARLRKIGGELKIESFATGTGASGTATSSALTADEWVHVAITMDRGTGIQIYIDGIADGLAAWTGPGNTGDLQANYNHLGAEWGSTGGNYFKGLMDEVRFTAGLLDSTTIAYDAANSLAGSRDQNRVFDAPQIGDIVCDGNLADWDEFSEQSLPFIWWKGDPNESATTASFAWSDANDMLYIAVETDVNSIQVGGHLAIGITLDPNSSPTATSSPGATQLMFDVAGGNSVDIGNEIQYYTDTYGFGWAGGGIEGVQAGQSTVVDGDSTITTYEIAIPLWEDWVLMSNGDTISPQELSVGTKVYLYAIMETALESDEGTNMTYFGDPNFWSGNWDEAAEIRLQILDRGHRVLLEKGLQIHALAWPFVTGSFDAALWEQSNFTGIDLHRSQYQNNGLLPPPPGMPWGRWTNTPPGSYSHDIEPGEYPFVSNMIRLQMSDEPDITDPAELAALAAAYASIHSLHPDIILHTEEEINNQTDEEVQHYMEVTRPDMIMFNRYPFYISLNTGSPTTLYRDLERYRKLGLAGNDGTGTRPIPTAVYTQAYIAGGINGYILSGSELQLNTFAALAFGYKFLESFIYDNREYDPGDPTDTISVFFAGLHTSNPTYLFYLAGEINRQALNLGPALVRLISTDVRMIMGRHDAEGSYSYGYNELPPGVAAWDSSADPYITSIAATNPGSKNSGMEGDVTIGYFKPLDASLVEPNEANDIYFMVVNGLSDQNGTPAECEQDITLEFDFGSSGIDSLLRLNRDTGLVERIQLQHDGGSQYHLDMELDGGSGDLFKFDNGNWFISFPVSGDTNNDRKVNLIDYANMAEHWQSDTATWENGDFDLDGNVTIIDLALLAGNWLYGTE